MSYVLRRLATRVPFVGLGLAIAWVAGRTGQAPPMPFEVPRAYAFLYDWSIPGPSAQRIRERLPIRSIVLERTPCYGSCPAYRLTLTRDGWAEYDGRMFTEREGRFRGGLPIGSFAMLAFATERIHLDEMRASYSVDVTDMPTTTVTVTRSDGRAFSISDYGDQAPPELWLLTTAMDGLAERIAWKEASAP